MAVRVSVAPLFQGPFLFLRHGESEANRAGMIAGSLDVPLTDLGREQAAAAARIIEGHAPGAIHASPLGRAWETARPVADRLGLPVTAVPGLKERNWGVLEGRPLCERVDPWAAVEGSETWDVFSDRVWAALEALPPGAELPLLVAHAGVMRVLRARLGLSIEEERIANALPIRFDPPLRSGEAWREIALG
jgi:probable phosphoglycerate mutase